MKSLDVVSICNALVDILVTASESDIDRLSLTKGIMHLVDDRRQQEVIQYFSQQHTTQELGGSCMNAIRSLAALGAQTSFAGTIGEDHYGKTIQSRMHDLGIKAHLSHAQAHTGLCFILVTPDGERTMNTSLGASCLFDENIVPKDDIAKAKIFHFSAYQWANPGQIRAIRKALEIAKDKNTLVSFDLADPFVVKNYRDQFIPLIEEYADIVFSNKEETRLLFDATPEVACNRLTNMNCIAAIKLGAEGALVGRGQERISVKAIPTTVVDTTAAGDMFAAGFLYGMSRNQSLQVCGQLAAVLASDVISRVGATVSADALKHAQRLAL